MGRTGTWRSCPNELHRIPVTAHTVGLAGTLRIERTVTDTTDEADDGVDWNPNCVNSKAL